MESDNKNSSNQLINDHHNKCIDAWESWITQNPTENPLHIPMVICSMLLQLKNIVSEEKFEEYFQHMVKKGKHPLLQQAFCFHALHSKYNSQKILELVVHPSLDPVINLLTIMQFELEDHHIQPLQYLCLKKLYKAPLTHQYRWTMLASASGWYTLARLSHNPTISSLKKLCLDKIQSLPSSFYKHEGIKENNKKPYATLLSLELDYGEDLERVLLSYENIVNQRPAYVYRIQPRSDGSPCSVVFEKAPSYNEIEQTVQNYTICRDPDYQDFKRKCLPSLLRDQKSNKKRMCLIQ